MLTLFGPCNLLHSNKYRNEPVYRWLLTSWLSIRAAPITMGLGNRIQQTYVACPFLGIQGCGSAWDFWRAFYDKGSVPYSFSWKSHRSGVIVICFQHSQARQLQYNERWTVFSGEFRKDLFIHIITLSYKFSKVFYYWDDIFWIVPIFFWLQICLWQQVDSMTYLEKLPCRRPTSLNAGEDVEQQELHSLLGECKMAWPPWKTVWQFLKKWDTLLP